MAELQLELQIETECGRMPESASATKARSKRHAVALEQPVACCIAMFKKSAEMRGVCGMICEAPKAVHFE